ncbi:MAG TPA: DUF1667 domain-containing protein [Firmicutes bacterium]|jgi:CxxC motif-containing protein|nr:DUF1667 domain-containing protein [Bacillota bacterium]
MQENIKIICIGCPLGCEITLTIGQKGKVEDMWGNSCKEGKAYALEEYQNPARILTSTVRTKNCSRPLLPVKTTKPVLKTELMQCISALARIRVSPPIKIGEVVLDNFLETGVDVIATDNL